MRNLSLKQDVKRHRILICALIGITSTGAYAEVPAWHLVTNESTLTFLATQNSAPVKGSFNDIDGTMHFDINQLGQSNASITIKTNSITTSYKPIADALLSEDWFDAKQYPQASFKSDKVTKIDDTHFQADGQLSIRDKTKPIKIDFVLESATKDKTKLKGEFSLKRSDFGLGRGEWASTDEIADLVTIEFEFSFAP